MIGIDVIFTDNTKAVEKAADRAGFKNVSHAAATVRNVAINSIKPGDEPSEPGTPPHTQTSGFTKKGKPRRGKLPRAIVFHVDKEKQTAIVGPRFSVVGESGAAHEFGGEFKGESYPERSFMAPALEEIAPRFGESFEGSM